MSGNSADASVGSNKAQRDSRLEHYPHQQNFAMLDCFPGADPVAIVGVEEKLFGYEFFGNKYTSEGCSLCGPSKRHNAAAPPRTGALMGGPVMSEEKKE